MRKKAVSEIMLTILFIGTLTLAFNIQETKSSEEPETEWIKTYGGTGSDYALCVVETSGGGYALAGYTSSFGAVSWDFWLVKTDASGNMEWNKTYGGADGDYARSVVETSDGGYALAGYGFANLVKTAADGNILWNKTYGGEAHSIVETSDGGYALAGSKVRGAWDDFWLVKVDSSGNHQWNKTYGGDYVDEGYSIVETSDGGYALAGLTQSFGVAQDDFWLVKVDSSGNHQWNKTYGGDSADRAWSVVETGDGGYALAGRTPSFGAGGTDFWLVKVDSSGNHQWNKTYGGTESDSAKSVVETSDGGYALAGLTNSFGLGVYDWDPWLVKVDSSGNHQWNKTYGGDYVDGAESVVETSDGGYALAGYVDLSGTLNSDGLLIKVAGSAAPPLPPPVGGKATPINIGFEPELQTPWLWLTTIILPLLATVVYFKLRKKKQ